MQISVIIPVYAVEKYIERCIQSILNQSFQDFEIIIVNDATPDKSMDIVWGYAKIDNRIRVFENPQNIGSMYSRREGYKNAQGNYFVFCDSDDYLPENALEILYNSITENKVDIVVASFQYVSERKKKAIKKGKLTYGTDSLSIYKSLLDGELFHSLWGKIFDRKLFDNHDYETFLHQTNGEDGILFYQIVKNIKELKVIEDVVYYYFINPNSFSRKLTENQYKQMIFTQNYIYDYVQNIENLDYFVEKSMIRQLLDLLKNGCNKKIVHKYSSLPNINQLYHIKKLSQYYSGIEFVCNYMIINSNFMRKFILFIHRILK
jgi:glycosyltransferase involved in cell wall biosynthesis